MKRALSTAYWAFVALWLLCAIAGQWAVSLTACITSIAICTIEAALWLRARWRELS